MARGSSSRIYCGNLPGDVREKDIVELFSKYGRIMSVDLKTKRGPPFAFIEYDDPRDADEAVHYRDGYKYGEYRLRVEFPRTMRGDRRDRGDRGDRRRPPPARRSDYRLLVSGLPVTGSWQDLKDFMRDAGDVCFADVYRDGTGVVEFTRYEDMKYAMKQMDGTRFRSHEGDACRVKLREEFPSRRRRSRSRSRSRDKKRGRSYSRSRSDSRSKSTVSKRDKSESRSRSKSPSRSRDKRRRRSSRETKHEKSFSKSVSRSPSRSPSRSRSRSKSRSQTLSDSRDRKTRQSYSRSISDKENGEMEIS